MHASSPLDISRPEGALQTQELKTTFKDEGAVIHEVDEENNPEEPSDANRHSILKAEKEGQSQPASNEASAAKILQQDATVERFDIEQNIVHGADEG